jgi:general secretion pathway protein H
MGFTLLELLVVLAIACSILLVAVPRLGGVLPSKRIDGLARNLAASLKDARSLAVTRNREVSFILDGVAGRFGVGNGVADGALPEGISVNLLTGRSEVSGGQRAAIRFFPDGSSTGGRIEVGESEHRRVVTVDWLTGRVQLEK